MDNVKQYTVDAIEEGMVRLLLRDDERVSLVMSVDALPPGVREGDIVDAVIRDGQVRSASINRQAIGDARARVNDLLNRLRQRR
jgi:hypothetical protein